MDLNNIKHLLPHRPQDSHKGSFGHVLNIAGSGFYSGAAYFSSLAPLKVGAGRSTLASVESVIRTVAALSPDIILYPLDACAANSIAVSSVGKLAPIISNYDVISIGCGLSITHEAKAFFEKFIKSIEDVLTPTVIDADGLNILSQLKKITLPQNTILTPHPLELSRLKDIPVEEVVADPEFWAAKCSKKYNCITVLKIHRTVISNKDGEIYVNNTGNSALAHGGSGDILTGIITGFLAQGMPPYEACILAVYLHGRTAEIASQKLTEYSTLASDLLDYIHLAIEELIC